jgi:hypothetical protein
LKTGFLNRLQHKALQSEIVAIRLTSADADDEPVRRSRRAGGGSRHYHRGGGPGGLRAAFFAAVAVPVAKPPPHRRSANNKSARCAFKKIAREQKSKQSEVTRPCFSHRKDKTNIRGIARWSRRIAWETRCPS